jgi:tetratricopeptide (TPR) repeat protein
MRVIRFLVQAVLVAVVVAAARPDALAQWYDRGGGEGNAERVRPARPPVVDRATRLEQLFDALQRAPDARAAQAVESRIEAILLQSGSATADLLIGRARTLIDSKDYDLSLELLDSTIEFEPGFTEAYAQRATVHFLRRRYDLAVADLRVVLAREPRHYTALSGLGVILQDIGRHALALEAFRRAVAVHPHLKGVPERIKLLEVRVEGREI